MDLALQEPVSLHLGDVPGFEALSGYHLRLPRPTRFVIHKALVLPLREELEKREKDYAYLLELALITRPRWEEMAAEVNTLRVYIPPKWMNRAVETLRRAFAGPGAEGCVGAARVFSGAGSGPAMTTEQTHRVMQRFFEATGISQGSSSR